MTLGSVMPLILVPFLLKFIQKKIGGAVNKNAAWANTMSAAAFIGLISAFIGRAVLGTGEPDQIGDGAGNNERCGACCFNGGNVRIYADTKKKKISWLEPLAMPLSMFIALGAVILLHEVLPGGIAVLEWRG